ncbi:unnamed protein product [Lactuca virosa]|uniref:T-complex protein 1 subunit zeta n=1 Tax=Lactuca virosa TaxID=75947 RepID=A0AAU9MBW0_9ASTR|nr:unnamed protein product [Lactuca virosa]
MTTFNDDHHLSMSPFSLLLRLPRFILLYICKLLTTHHLFDALFLYYRNGKDTWEKTKRPSPPVVEYIISRLNIFPSRSTQLHGELDTRIGVPTFFSAILRYFPPELSAKIGAGLQYDRSEKLHYTMHEKKVIPTRPLTPDGAVNFVVKGRCDLDKEFKRPTPSGAAELVWNILDFQKNICLLKIKGGVKRVKDGASQDQIFNETHLQNLQRQLVNYLLEVNTPRIAAGLIWAISEHIDLEGLDPLLVDDPEDALNIIISKIQKILFNADSSATETNKLQDVQAVLLCAQILGSHEAVVRGAGAFEVAARQHLINFRVKKTVKGRAQLGVQAFADALLIVPKTLAKNSGLDTQDVIISLTGEHDNGNVVGLNQHTGDPIDPQMEGIFDNYAVKLQIIKPVIASQLLLVDEVIRAGRNIR